MDNSLILSKYIIIRWRAQPPALTENSCGCFLPDLTGFAAIRRVGPNSQHRNSPKEASSTRPLGGIQSR